ncbi:MAG: HEAT repeat domain-containing protein [Verrucomicrobiales bacterium]|nr:HEAT repeat domain-containing protein [Verrucomicrobiales bacterium]
MSSLRPRWGLSRVGWGLALSLGLSLGLGRAAEKTVPEYARDLVSSDRDLKREASYQLSRPGVDAREALPQLIEALGDAQQQVWFGAVTALANLGPRAEPALPALWQELEAWEPFRRDRQGMQSLLRTAQALGAVGPAAVPLLTNGLAHAKWHVRAASAVGLGFTRELALPAIPLLVPLLEDGRAEVREAAAETLAGLGTPSAEALKVVLVQGSTPAQRRAAAMTLGRMGRAAEVAVVDLRRLWNEDADRAVRLACLGAVAQLQRGAPETVGLLIGAWNSGVAEFEEAAAKELVLMRPPSDALLGAIRTALVSSDTGAQVKAARLMAQMGREAGPLVGTVVSLLDGEPPVPEGSGSREALISALVGVGRPALPALLQHAERVPLANLTTNDWAVAAIRRLDATSSSALAAALVHSAPSIRAAGLEGLDALGEGARLQAKALIPLLSDPEPGVRSRAWVAASRCGVDSELLAKRLPGALGDADARVRRSAVAAVARLGRGALPAVPLLVKEMASPEPEARDAALAALATLGPDAAEATGELARMLDTAAGGLREQVLRALGEIGPGAAAAVGSVETLARDGDLKLRRVAVEVLGRLKEGAKPALATLLAAGRESEANLRGAALLALVQVDAGAEGVLPLVIAALDDSDGSVRRAAADALAKVGEKGRPAEARLFAMLADPAMRGPAREALRSIQPTSVSHLVEALTNEEVAVRQMAADALARLGKEAGEAVGALERLSREDPSEDVKRACRRAMRRIREG